MEAQICKLLEEFCNRKLEQIHRGLHTTVNMYGIKFYNINMLSSTEPWLEDTYSNPYHQCLRDAVLILRKLYGYW
jgi:hypothetical protein